MSNLSLRMLSAPRRMLHLPIRLSIDAPAHSTIAAGPGTENPNRPLVLASASFDALIKIWDVEYGKALHTLKKHSDSVRIVLLSVVY